MVGDYPSTDVSDRAARLLGKIYGDQGVLTQNAADKALLTREQSPITGFALESAGNLAAIKAKTDNLDVALSTRALEAGGNLAAILAKLDVALSTRALEAGGNLASVKTNTDPLVTAAGAAYVRPGTSSTWDMSDRAARDLGAIRGSAGYYLLQDVLPPALAQIVPLVTEPETGYMLTQGKLFGAGQSVTNLNGNSTAYVLTNPNGSGITIRVKTITIFASISFIGLLVFDAAPANLSAANTGKNLVVGGAAAQSNVKVSANAGAVPAFTSAISMLAVGPNIPVNFPVDIQIIANHNLTIWFTGTGVTTDVVNFVWEEL